MSVVIAICVAVIFAVSVYMLLGGELKGVAMGVFLLSHAANLSILAMSGSPVVHPEGGPARLKEPPLVGLAQPGSPPLEHIVDPLPQALILTAIVISFAIMAFMLTLIVVTGRSTKTLNVDELAEEERPAALAPGPVTPGPSASRPSYVTAPETGPTHAGPHTPVQTPS